MKIIQIISDNTGRILGLSDDGELYQFNLATRDWDKV